MCQMCEQLPVELGLFFYSGLPSLTEASGCHIVRFSFYTFYSPYNRFWWLMHSLHHTYGPWVMELNQQTMWQRRVSFTVTLDRWGVLESIAISGRSSMIALAGLCPVQLELSQFSHYLCSKSQFPPGARVMCIHAFTLSLNCCRIDSWVLWAGGWALYMPTWQRWVNFLWRKTRSE